MYLREIHAEHDIPTLRKFIRENPLGIFTTAIESALYPFIQSSHIPWILDVENNDSTTELGTLRGHMARANPQTKAIIDSLKSDGSPTWNQLEKDVMILFNSPVHHYVTPKFYKETKPTTAKVVPTWDYAAVQVYGKATVYLDSTADTFLAKQISDLSQYSETHIMKHESPWQVEDAPVKYVELLKKAIIGIEVKITDMGGKWKMSQELKEGDRQGVIEGFEEMGSEEGKKLAETIKARAVVASSTI